MQCRNERTGDIALLCVALVDHFGQHFLDFLQPVDLFTHVPKLVLGKIAGFLTVGAFFQPEQVADFVETKAIPLPISQPNNSFVSCMAQTIS
ncbi:hypothetical protein HNR62_001500 [Oceanisphaera litoralis]|nr:hypothetical protein [Oceanisphaera litoralis]